MATTNSGSLQVDFDNISIDKGTKDMTVNLSYFFVSSGKKLDNHLLRFMAASNNITDLDGNVVSAIPAAITTARDALLYAISGSMVTGSAAQKLER